MKHKKQNNSMMGDVMQIGGTGLTMGAFGIASSKLGMTGMSSALSAGSGWLSPMMNISMAGHTIKQTKKLWKYLK